MDIVGLDLADRGLGAGAHLVASGLAPGIGMISATRLFEATGLLQLEDLVFGGCDLRDMPAAHRIDDLIREHILPCEVRAQAILALERMPVTPLAAIVSDGRAPGDGLRIVDGMVAEFSRFRRERKVERAVVVNLSSTEQVSPLLDRLTAAASIEELDDLLENAEAPVPWGVIYAYAAIKAGCALVNFTPNLGTPALRLEFAQHWHDRTIVLPHSIFLAVPELLERLGTVLRMRLAGVRTRLRPASAPRKAPPVTVAVVTQGRPTLRAALASVRAQRYRGELRLLVIADESNRAFDPGLLSDEARGAAIELVRVKSPSSDAEPVIARIARLRNLAIDMARTPLLTFLDDDNTWHPDHLDALNQARGDGRYWAVHSWRRLVDAQGEPLAPIGFPWLPRSTLERKTFAACLALGLLTEGDPIVRDRTRAIHEGIDYGMVDCGAWLFDRRLFHAIRSIRTIRTMTSRSASGKTTSCCARCVSGTADPMQRAGEPELHRRRDVRPWRQLCACQRKEKRE